MNRRAFLSGLAVSGVAAHLPAQTTGARASVTDMEREHILAESKAAMQLATAPEELVALSASIAALVAAYVLTKDETYATKAAGFLRERFLTGSPSARIRPYLEKVRDRESILLLLPFAEIARALSFLVDSPSLRAQVTGGPDKIGRVCDCPASEITEFFVLQNAISSMVKTSPVEGAMQLARDSKDHLGSAWLLLCSTMARLQGNERGLDVCRQIFKKPTLRNQIDPTGRFPQEAASDNPLRNTLFNFDLLCGCAQILSTPFEDLWSFELLEGVGLRSAASYLYPLLAAPAKWPLPADASNFRDVPLRRPGLLLAGRAYLRPEYVDLFRSLPTTPPVADLAYSLPIRQPLLWTTKAPHGL